MKDRPRLGKEEMGGVAVAEVLPGQIAPKLTLPKFISRNRMQAIMKGLARYFGARLIPIEVRVDVKIKNPNECVLLATVLAEPPFPVEILIDNESSRIFVYHKGDVISWDDPERGIIQVEQQVRESLRESGVLGPSSKYK